MSEEQPIGTTLDALGITAAIAPDTLVSGAVVLLKTVTADGRERLSVAHSDGIGWTERAGMLHIASTMATNSAAGQYEPGA